MTSHIPRFIYGTAWKEGETATLVELALKSGFKGIDSANQRKHYYEKGVGDGIRSAIDKGYCTQGELFLQSKFTYAHGQDDRLPYDRDADFSQQVEQSFTSTLENLQSDYLESYILHGPYTMDGLTHADFEVWAAMEKLYQQKKVGYLGVSNINLSQLMELCDKSFIKPHFVQNRCFAITQWDKAIREYCTQQSIIYQGFSLLTANNTVVTHSKVLTLAKNLCCTPAQLIFAFAKHIGILPLTGTTNSEHMQQDLMADDIDITEEVCDTIIKVI